MLGGEVPYWAGSKTQMVGVLRTCGNTGMVCMPTSLAINLAHEFKMLNHQLQNIENDYCINTSY